jgi:hypothetical protein
LANWRQVLPLFNTVADSLQYGPWISISSQRKVPDDGERGERNSDELDRPEGAKTGATEWWT